MNNQPQKTTEHLSYDEQKLKTALNHHLNTEKDNLDFNVTNKLAAARHRALSQEKPSVSLLHGSWVNRQSLAGTSAALAVALVVGNQLYSPAAVTNTTDTILTGTSISSTTLTSSDLMEDLPILSASDDIEFYQSIEFLEWMESNS